MDKDDTIGRIIHYGTIFLLVSLMGYSGGAIFVSGLYGYVYPPGWDRALMHSMSLLSLSSSALTIYLSMKYLMPLVRTIITLTITVWSIQVYDLGWSLIGCSITGGMFPWLTALVVLAVTFLLERFDDKHGFRCKQRFWTGRKLIQLLLICIFVLSFQGMVRTGFFQAMEMYNMGLGTDPNVGNIYWLISKVVVFWISFPMISNKGGSAPLRLDPKVLIW